MGFQFPMHFEVSFSDRSNIAALHRRIFVLALVLHTLKSDYPSPCRPKSSSYKTHITFNPLVITLAPLLEMTDSHAQSHPLY